LMTFQNIAVGTLDVFIDDTDVEAQFLLGASSTGTTGTINVHLGSRVRWTQVGAALNALQVGGGTWSIWAAPGCVIPADRLALFGFGTPTYRINIPSSTAGININGANYSGAQVVPVNGDVVYNNNAGALAIGPVVRRAGAWTAL